MKVPMKSQITIDMLMKQDAAKDLVTVLSGVSNVMSEKLKKYEQAIEDAENLGVPYDVGCLLETAKVDTVVYQNKTIFSEMVSEYGSVYKVIARFPKGVTLAGFRRDEVTTTIRIQGSCIIILSQILNFLQQGVLWKASKDHLSVSVKNVYVKEALQDAFNACLTWAMIGHSTTFM